jgi:hypothetical protein
MLWDVWIVGEDNRTRVLVRNVTEKRWKEISKTKLPLFRVPSGFLLKLLRTVDDLVEVD